MSHGLLYDVAHVGERAAVFEESAVDHLVGRIYDARHVAALAYRLESQGQTAELVKVRLEKLKRLLEQVKALGIYDVLCHNLGALYLAKQLGMTLHGGFGLNLVNTFDLLWAEEYGLRDTDLSFELTFDRINALGGNLDRGIISYGYLPLMLCRNCPAKSEGIDCKTCKNHSKMTDRLGKTFLLKCDGNCTEVLNSVPLYIDDKEISKLSTSFNVLNFYVENYVENVNNIANAIPFSMLKDKFTRGLYKRGVE